MRINKYLFSSIKRLAWKYFPLQCDEYKRRKWNVADSSTNICESPDSKTKLGIKLGIIMEFTNGHKDYVSACRDMEIPCEVLDLSGSDWLDVIKKSNCDAFLVRPSCELSIWKQMFDERLRVMAFDLGKIIYPTYEEIWFYESKRRMCYWLQAHDVPYPRTWIFYNYKEAQEFANNTDLPIVFKTDFGSASTGVKIIYTRSQLHKIIKKCFGKGITCKGEDTRDRQWGVVLFQEYLPDVREWRIAKIGDSYFGYEKLKNGEYHSGSLKREYNRLSDELLSFAKKVMEKGRFTSMSLDIFQTVENQYLVNELQTMFGMSRPEMCVVDQKSGRMIFNPDSNSWNFEIGDFCRNHLCNLRVQTLLSLLKKELRQGPDVQGCGDSLTPPVSSPNRYHDV